MIQYLPEEILLKIVSDLSHKDLQNFKKVSKNSRKFYKRFKNFIYWKKLKNEYNIHDKKEFQEVLFSLEDLKRPATHQNDNLILFINGDVL